MTLNVKAFAVTCGSIWGVGLLLLTWWLFLIEGPTGEPTLIERVYPGYTVSPAGSIVGFIWGYIDGVISGAIFAWLYNLLSAKFRPQIQE